MLYLRKISVRSRFVLVMATVTVSLLGVGLWGLASSETGNETTSRLFQESTAASTEVGNLRESLSNLRRYEATMMATASANPTGVEDVVKLWKQELVTTGKIGERLVAANARDTAIAAMVATQNKLLADYAAVITPIAAQLQGATMDATVALAYAGKAEDTLKLLQQNTRNLLQAQQAKLENTRSRLADDASMASRLRLLLVGGTLALFLPLMWLTLRSVCGPLDEAIGVASRIAKGDLGAEWTVHETDEPAKLMHALQAMQQELRALVGKVRESAGNIQTASSEVASGNTDLSERTEQTASNLQQTASSMTELTGAVRQSAQAAAQASQLASSASDVARRGGEVVSRMVSTMDEINASSKKISDIIGVIDGIAFQTNILALNAAVEAARAGEQGRGFAVVASEVRSLAHRSAEAAKEIKVLIGTSVTTVESGLMLVQGAGTTMNEIVVSVKRVADIIGEITAASAEQSGGIEQVNAAVMELDRMTQQNAALVEQSAAASESLRNQAVVLAGTVFAFRCGDDERAAGRAGVDDAA
ncbi:methyl-accepting chemotaxis protein [soil metagenome]